MTAAAVRPAGGTRFSALVRVPAFWIMVAVLAAGAVTWLRRRPEELTDALGAAVYGGMVGAIAVLVSLVASYVVVQADRAARDPRRRGRWALPVIQAVLPLAACAPVALALAYRTGF